MSKVIGIDLGTTNSVVALFDGSKPVIIPSVCAARTTPSVVALTEAGQWLVGPSARNQQVTNPAGTIYSIKRFMGRRHGEVQREQKIVPYKITGKPDEFVKVQIGRRQFMPQQISALILDHLRRTAEAYVGEPVTRAVITVPAYFNDSQRQATKDAGAIAGLKVERIINEPTAAALAYGMDKKESKRIVVVDFGGGTFDLSVLDIGEATFRVQAVHGNTHLGGDDFDQRIIDVVADDFRRKERIDLRDDPMALQRLKEAAEVAKVELSHRQETMISLPFVCVDGSGPRHLQYRLDRETFESLAKDLFDEVEETCRVAIQDLALGVGGISDVVLVGGSTRLPKVQEIARNVYHKRDLDKSINPDEVVALGAAILGGVIQGDLRKVELMDVTAHSLGVETAAGGAAKLMPKSTPIPTTLQRVFSTPRDHQTSVHVRVLEGEATTMDANRTIGLFHLRGIQKATRGVPKIEVTFGIDSDGILTVTAVDKTTGRKNDITIEGGVGLDHAQIEQMQREFKVDAQAEDARLATVDLKNHAEEVLHDVAKWLQYNRSNMLPRSAAMITTALQRLEKKIARGDSIAVKAALKKLDEVMVPVRKAS